MRRKGLTYTLLPVNIHNCGLMRIPQVVVILLFLNKCCRRVISGFRRGVNDFCVLLPFHATRSGYYLSTFQNNLSVHSSRVKPALKRPLTVYKISYSNVTCCGGSLLRNVDE